MSLQSYRTLGKSGLRVSPLSLGAMTFGEDWGWGASVEESTRIMNMYVEKGGNFIDTANIYTNNHSERIIGDVIGKNSSLRTQIVIATKFANNVFPGNPNTGGTGNKSLMTNLEHSLRRLQTDYIDLFWIHSWDFLTPMEETMRSLDNAVKSGKIRYIGISDAPAWKIAQAQTAAYFKDWTPFIGLQIEYSLLQRTVEDELIPMAQELGLGITLWSPLKGGLLSGKYNRENSGNVSGRLQTRNRDVTLTETQLTIIDELQRIAQSHNTTPAAVALSWVNNKPGVTSTIIGVRNVQQLEANIAATDVHLTHEEIASLDSLSTPPKTFWTEYKEPIKMMQHGGIEIDGLKPAPLPLLIHMQPGKY
ncbi:aldo/keto reductase [Cytophagaceae bacterium YF14B1]|uniref:Aldo/keto reductase n=1 Tax=Xanthocytophaga flava TaxID=3048013 RepID=A0AAE3QMZ2_9BACT|nr:aldo/keto reductase [Xanthocytophaga flavus]MDJ1479891.1 aldo/keto reductase [Xanthocytophaga flavus]